jgi:hypothetical protein
VRRIFRSGEGVSGLIPVPVYEEAGVTDALLPGGKLLRIASGGGATTVALPALPRGYRYTDVVRVGGTLVLPWQQDSFTDVGAAGLLLYAPD